MQSFPEIISHCILGDRRMSLFIWAIFPPRGICRLERMSAFLFWAWNVNQIWCEISVFVYQTISYLIGCQCLKSLGTVKINLSYCLWQSQDPVCFTLYTIWKAFFGMQGSAHQEKGSLPAYILQVLAGCFQHSLTHYLLSHIFSWVKGFSGLFCSVPIFFFSIVKNPSSHTRKSIYVACTSTPSWLCCCTEVQTELWSLDIVVSIDNSEDDTASRGAEIAKISPFFHHKHVAKVHPVRRNRKSRD